MFWLVSSLLAALFTSSLMGFFFSTGYEYFVSTHQITPCPDPPKATEHACEQVHGLFSGHGHGLHQHPDAGPGCVHLLWGERGELEITKIIAIKVSFKYCSRGLPSIATSTEHSSCILCEQNLY